MNYKLNEKINYKDILVSYRSLQMLHNTLNDIIDFNYILTNELAFSIEKQNLQNFLKNIIEIISDLAEMKGL